MDMEKNWAKEIVDAFTETRIKRGWTYRRAAAVIGISAGYLAAVENRMKIPSENVLEKMAKVLISEQKANRSALKVKDLIAVR